MQARAFILGGMALGASLLLAAAPVRAEVYAFGIMGSGGVNAEHATAPPGGYAASMGLGYAHHFPTFFLALEGTSDFNTAKFAISDVDEESEMILGALTSSCTFALNYGVPLSTLAPTAAPGDIASILTGGALVTAETGTPCDPEEGIQIHGSFAIEQEVLVQFGMNLRAGARFERAEVSLFLGPHWARVETTFQPYQSDFTACEEARQMLPPPPETGTLTGTIISGCLPTIGPTDHVVRSASIWSGFRLGATASWPLSEQWALRTEYRYAQISGRHRGWFHTLHQHDALLGVQYAF